jgi:fumarate reductase flavoprotein subunit
VTEERDDVFDVVVAGAGLAGHVAALTAAEAGAKVLLLEKGPEFGGSSVRAGGGLAFAGTDVQRAAGIDDSAEALRADLVRIGGGHADEALIDAYVDHQLETFEWLRAVGVGISLADPTVPGEVARIHLTGSGVATRHLHARAMAHGLVTYRSNVEVSRLHRGTDSRVDTVATGGPDGPRLTATRGVVLATGGFARSVELVEAFAPQWTAAVPMSGRHNTGDGIRMACDLGAGLADLPYVSASFGASVQHYPDLTLDPDEKPILLFPNARGAIIVNLDARRFGNEDLNYKQFSRLCAEQPGAVAVQIFDEPIFRQSDDRALPLDFEAALKSGLLRRGDSLAGLAAELLLDPEVLEATVARYNDGVRAGSDPDFGRVMCFGGNPGGGLIATAPFYGFPTRSGLTSTYAGVTVDATMRVLDVYGGPIPGLYAAGETVGGFHGAGYYSGTGMGKAAVFGRIAGRAAAT